MAHLVRYSTPAGDDVFEDVNGLESAVARVEQLRNDGSATDARVYVEVPLQVETVVRVSVAPHTAPEPVTVPSSSAGDPEAADWPDASTQGTPPAEEALAPVPPLPGAMLAPVRVAAPSADAEDLVDADGTARRGLFHR